jgi:RNA polymerase sigma factor (sigma-70 family)
LRVIRKITDGYRDEQTSDRELLRRFVENRDQGAFAGLIRRHGSMVLGVALRVLRHYQDAEDVCQATFLLLATKAGATAWRDSVANWLYEVAYHLALKARTRADRQCAREAKVPPRTPPDALAEIAARELQRVLDEELSRLPRKYRSPLILYCLEGKSRDEAAHALAVPLSTVISRLERGRELLRGRLARRGVLPSVALAGVTLLAEPADAALPATLMRALSQAAMHAAAGEELASIVSVRIASLVKEGLQVMFLVKLKTVAACTLVCALACVAAWAVLPSTLAQESPNRRPVFLAPSENPADERAQASGPGAVLLNRLDGLVALTPEGKTEAELTAPADTRLGLECRFSPDRRRVAYIVSANGPLRPPARVGEVPEPWPFKVVVQKVGKAKPTALVDLPAYQLLLTWAPDGKRLLVTRETSHDGSFESILLDPETGKDEPLPRLAGMRVVDWSRDGKTFLVVYRRDRQDRLALMTPDDEKPRDLIALKGLADRDIARLSPNGKRVLYADTDPADKDAHRWGWSSKLYLLDVATRQRQPLADFPANGQAGGVAWAPDGKRIAYTWKQVHADLLKKDSLSTTDLGVATEAFLMVADVDGKNAQTVASGRCDNALNRIFGSIDWR